MSYTGTPSQTGHSGNVNAGYNVTRQEQWRKSIWYHQPIETPLLNALPRFEVRSPIVQWPVGYLNFDFASNTLLADNEGEQHDPNTQRYRYRLSNYTHIASKDFMVSRTQRVVSEVGVEDEYVQHMWEAGVELKQEFEKIVLWSRDQAGTVTSTAGTERTMCGLIPWAYQCAQSTRPQIAADTVPATFSSTWYEKSPDGNMTRDELNDQILLPFFNSGGQISRAKMFVGPQLKLVISQFAHSYQGSGPTLTAAPVNDRTISAASRRINESVDYFDTDFGTLEVSISRYLSGSSSNFTIHDADNQSSKVVTPNDTMVMFDPNYLELGVLSDFHHQKLAPMGDSTQGFVLGEFTLVVKNPKALVGGDGLTA